MVGKCVLSIFMSMKGRCHHSQRKKGSANFSPLLGFSRRPWLLNETSHKRRDVSRGWNLPPVVKTSCQNFTNLLRQYTPEWQYSQMQTWNTHSSNKFFLIVKITASTSSSLPELLKEEYCLGILFSAWNCRNLLLNFRIFVKTISPNKSHSSP